MALSLASASLSFSPAVAPRAVVKMETSSDMVTLAEKLNPVRAGRMLSRSCRRALSRRRSDRHALICPDAVAMHV